MFRCATGMRVDSRQSAVVKATAIAHRAYPCPYGDRPGRARRRHLLTGVNESGDRPPTLRPWAGHGRRHYSFVASLRAVAARTGARTSIVSRLPPVSMTSVTGTMSPVFTRCLMSISITW